MIYNVPVEGHVIKTFSQRGETTYLSPRDIAPKHVRLVTEKILRNSESKLSLSLDIGTTGYARISDHDHVYIASLERWRDAYHRPAIHVHGIVVAKQHLRECRGSLHPWDLSSHFLSAKALIDSSRTKEVLESIAHLPQSLDLSGRSRRPNILVLSFLIKNRFSLRLLTPPEKDSCEVIQLILASVPPATELELNYITEFIPKNLGNFNLLVSKYAKKDPFTRISNLLSYEDFEKETGADAITFELGIDLHTVDNIVQGLSELGGNESVQLLLMLVDHLRDGRDYQDAFVDIALNVLDTMSLGVARQRILANMEAISLAGDRIGDLLIPFLPKPEELGGQTEDNGITFLGSLSSIIRDSSLASPQLRTVIEEALVTAKKERERREIAQRIQTSPLEALLNLMNEADSSAWQYGVEQAARVDKRILRVAVRQFLGPMEAPTFTENLWTALRLVDYISITDQQMAADWLNTLWNVMALIAPRLSGAFINPREQIDGSQVLHQLLDAKSETGSLFMFLFDLTERLDHKSPFFKEVARALGNVLNHYW